MLITFFRPFSHDEGFIESTWHHVPEIEGVQYQFEEEFNHVLESIDHSFGYEPVIHHQSTRRIVTGEFHPGRRILPASAIYHELVYKIDFPPEWSEKLILDRIKTCSMDVGRVFEYEIGDVTHKKEDENAA